MVSNILLSDIFCVKDCGREFEINENHKLVGYRVDADSSQSDKGYSKANVYRKFNFSIIKYKCKRGDECKTN